MCYIKTYLYFTVVMMQYNIIHIINVYCNLLNLISMLYNYSLIQLYMKSYDSLPSAWSHDMSGDTFI